MRDSFKQTKRSLDTLIYIAQKDKESELDDFGNKQYMEPRSIYCCVTPLEGYTDVTAYGENVTKMYKTLIDKKKFEGVFNEGDKAYLEGFSPKDEKKHGSKANYIIDSVRNQNKKICIYFQKVSKGN